jgi:FAD/FMN-containing dehydrogenase
MMESQKHVTVVAEQDRTIEAKMLVQLRTAIGDASVMDGAEAVAFATGWSRLGTPIALARPTSTADVARVVTICAAAGVPVVPWGGRTGLVSGALADGAVAISLDRMNRVQSIDPTDGTMLVEAGCVLQTACEAAEAVGMFFPLDLGARGSATIGGTISTNAGGNRVVRFGMMRDLVLGVEVVLADGTILSSLKPLVKNNTGYDLKQLFIGAEGTLGIVTRAMLRVRPTLPSRCAALVAVKGFEQAAQLLRTLEARLGGQLSAFEAMWSDYYVLVTTAPAHGRPILPHGFPFYILVEAMGGDLEGDQDRFESVLADAMEAGLVADAVIARSEGDAEAMWAVRDDGEQVGRIGPYVALDVSLRVSVIDGFVIDLRQMLEARWPGTRLILFGHVGDGNIHVIVSAGDNLPHTREAITTAVLELAGQNDGSISAEHGIGLDKRDYLPLSRSPEEIGVMWLIKRALDPHNIMNPGKMLTPPAPQELV